MQKKLVIAKVAIFVIATIFGFLSLITGLILYFWPRGPRAGWIVLYGLDKQTWGEIHTYLSLISILAILIHLIVNRKSIKLYIDTLKKL
ncbi:MAG: hypothetical protein DSO01_04770 [Archaeoglobi archaeon]|jgi:cytochrome b subunit of formate dehydrogenase|nr:DUF4405 domain-containing protein [Archaeoglobus sp.]NHW88195.1 DUF4405 domain-containing protein [Archaeoglobales archaeon]TDA26806.1 MAG: hypothetical protein DSO01_04770 [Archaeoglobi archaeon]TDA29195.1 MAG: hypothetical protein DSN99_00420 [Archaeoglobi archaeon]